MAYKAQSLGKSEFMPFRVQHDEALGSGDRVNAAVCARRKYPWGIAKDHVLIRGDLSDERSLFWQRPVWQHAG